jgi:hypothetical protein
MNFPLFEAIVFELQRIGAVVLLKLRLMAGYSLEVYLSGRKYSLVRYVDVRSCTLGKEEKSLCTNHPESREAQFSKRMDKSYRIAQVGPALIELGERRNGGKKMAVLGPLFSTPFHRSLTRMYLCT